MKSTKNALMFYKELDLKTAKAWVIKENLRLFWDQPTKAHGIEHFKR
jgi:hypothetical protein